MVWGIITANPAMADGNALFHTTHKNLAGTGTALAVDAVGAARAVLAEIAVTNAKLDALGLVLDSDPRRVTKTGSVPLTSRSFIHARHLRGFFENVAPLKPG